MTKSDLTASYRAVKVLNMETLVYHSCIVCGAAFEKKHKDAKTCGKECSKEHRRRHRAGKSAERYQKNSKVREYRRLYHKRNRERQLQAMKEYYKKNKEVRTKINCENYGKNREQRLEQRRQYRAKNKEKILKARREYDYKCREAYEEMQKLGLVEPVSSRDEKIKLGRKILKML